MSMAWLTASCLIAAALPVPGTGNARASEDTKPIDARASAAVIGTGVESAQWKRLLAVLEAEGVDVLPAEQTARVQEELTRHGVTCSDDTVDCLARIAVLANVTRAIRIWPADGALEVLVVDATPTWARAQLRDRDDDAGWSAALAGALALAPSAERVELPAVTTAAESPPRTPRVDFAIPQLVGALALGAGGVGLGVAAFAAVLAAQSIAAAQSDRFQDDAVAHAAEANARLVTGGVVLAASAAAAAGGAALLVLNADVHAAENADHSAHGGVQ